MKYFYALAILLIAAIQNISAQLSATTSSTNPSCAADNGSASVTPSGGSGYIYKWSNGGTTSTISNLSDGTYTVTVYNGGGNTTWDSIYLETFDSTVQTWSINISTGSNGNLNNYWDISDSCIGNGAIGSCVNNTYSPPSNSNKSLYITSQPNGFGIPEYAGARYDAGGSIGGLSFCGTLGFCTETNLAAQSPNINTTGTHNLVLSFQYTAGGNGLMDNASVLYSVDGGTSFSILDSSLKSVNSGSCAADGDIEGTWTYKSYVLPDSCTNISNLVIRFNWTNDGLDACSCASDPSVAVDNVTLRDSTPGAIIDSIVQTVVLTAPSIPQFVTTSLNITEPTCGQNNGSITGLGVTGGTHPYTVEWDNSSNVTLNNSYPLTNVGADTYTFKVSDSVGCKTDTSFTLVASGGPHIVNNGLIIVNPGCALANGSIIGLSGGGGAGPLTVKWENGAHQVLSHSDSLLNIGSGSYIFIVSDSAGCTVDTSLSVIASTGPHIISNGLMIVSPGCGLQNGSVTGLSYGGGTPPITVKWENSLNQIVSNSNSLLNAGAGTYSFIVSDSGNCTADTTLTLAALAGPHIISTGLLATNPTCGQNNGSITGLTGGGGTLPYSVNWMDSTGNILSHRDSLIHAGGGLYTFAVTDSGGCSSDTSIRLVEQGGVTAPVISASEDSICSGDSTSVCASPQNYPHYLWNNGAATACLEVTISGTYNLVVSDSFGCTASSNSVSIGQYIPSPLTISVSGDTLRCYSGSSFQWFLNDNAISGATSSVYVADVSGLYTVQISDTHGCYVTSTGQQITVGGIASLANDIDFAVYPNPVNDNVLDITTPASAIGQIIEVFDASGRLILSATIKDLRNKMDVAQLSSGVYLIRMGSVVKKLVKE